MARRFAVCSIGAIEFPARRWHHIVKLPRRKDDTFALVLITYVNFYHRAEFTRRDRRPPLMKARVGDSQGATPAVP
jgi:hypothetical protein